jgi:hypothetical protein
VGTAVYPEQCDSMLLRNVVSVLLDHNVSLTVILFVCHTDDGK